jgi:DNA-binding LytR/AlgR family response regulator
MNTCYIIDDEEHAIETLVRHINRHPGLELLGSNLNPVKGINEIINSKTKADIVFLDVDMPELNGLEAADILVQHASIIFTTAFPNYAVQAFEKNGADFLLKPISFERFTKSVTKVQSLIKLQRTAESPKEDEFFFINPGAKGKAIQLSYAETIYIEGLKNYVVIYTTDEKHITYMSMSEIEKALPSLRFVRIHKSYIVNIDRIKSIDGNTLTVSNKTELPVGTAFKDAFFHLVNAKTLKSGRKGG